MTRCFLALGGNLGPVEETFRSALARLDATAGVRVVQRSGVHRSAAVGRHAGTAFRNAAAEIETDRRPLDLLDLLQAVEQEHGRTRTLHWGPRTLDLDLLLYGDAQIHEPRLRVPHPALWYRRFVLDPLDEIAPQIIHPEKRVTIHALRERLLPRPLRVALTGGDAHRREPVRAGLCAAFPQVEVSEWTPAEPEPMLLAWLGPDAAEDVTSFDQLPLVPRLDASGTDDATQFLADVVQSALGE